MYFFNLHHRIPDVCIRIRPQIFRTSDRQHSAGKLIIPRPVVVCSLDIFRIDGRDTGVNAPVGLDQRRHLHARMLIQSLQDRAVPYKTISGVEMPHRHRNGAVIHRLCLLQREHMHRRAQPGYRRRAGDQQHQQQRTSVIPNESFHRQLPFLALFRPYIHYNRPQGQNRTGI